MYQRLYEMFIVNTINVCWYIMKCICYICNKVYKFYNLSIKNFYKTFHIVPYIRNTIVVKDSNIIHDCNYNDLLFFYNLEYDYALYKYQDLSSNYKLIKLITHLNNIVYLKNRERETLSSNIAFIHVKLQILDLNLNIIEIHDITSFLKNCNESYYVVDAKLFAPFFMNWIFIKHLKRQLANYKLVILDHNIKEVIILKGQYIKIGKTSYEIISA